MSVREIATMLNTPPEPRWNNNRTAPPMVSTILMVPTTKKTSTVQICRIRPDKYSIAESLLCRRLYEDGDRDGPKHFICSSFNLNYPHILLLINNYTYICSYTICHAELRSEAWTKRSLEKAVLYNQSEHLNPKEGLLSKAVRPEPTRKRPQLLTQYAYKRVLEKSYSYKLVLTIVRIL